jgi:uncharacterized membrane protein YbhN (UPF0104 family)
VALLVAIVLQRGTVTEAVGELGGLGPWTLVALGMFVLVDRLVRGLMIRRAVGGLTRVEGVVMHDVGAAASYGLPGGGVVGTGLRYHVAQTASIETPSFLAGLTAYGVAISAATWLLPLGVLGLEMSLGKAGLLDAAMMAVCVTVLLGSALFWWLVIRSDRLLERAVRIGEWLRSMTARWRSSIGELDVRSGLTMLRDQLRASLPNLPSLVLGALLMQLIAASILLVTLYGLGVTGHLGILEFARIFFVTRVVATLAPTPGGVGVIEAGMTAAIASAGVPVAAAAAGVLVFRLATYVVPIVSGAACWVVWRRRPAGESSMSGPIGSSTHEVIPTRIE